MKLLIIFLSLIFASSALADQLRFLRDDNDALQARVDIIQQAKKEILVEYFYVGKDNQSLGGIALLMEAAKRGVKVKVIVDALFNSVAKKTLAALLAEGKDKDGNQNLEIKEYNPLGLNLMKATHRDHAKMIIIDDEILLTGGRNVGDGYFGINRTRNFSDLDLLAKGELAQHAKENFMETWESRTTKAPSLKRYSESNLKEGYCKRSGPRDNSYTSCENRRRKLKNEFEAERQRIHHILTEILTDEDDDIVLSGTGKDWFEETYELDIRDLEFSTHGTSSLVSKETAYLNETLLRTIAEAQHEVNIISPYLIPTKKLLEVFKELLNRNVRIRIITNSLKSTDNLFAQAGYREVKAQLIEMGLEIYEYNGPDTIHAKTSVVDNKIALIGTYNIDPRSAFLNREIAVLIHDRNNIGLATELTQIIDVFRLNSTLVGKDGEAFNQNFDMEGVSKLKKAMLKAIHLILPMIRNQL